MNTEKTNTSTEAKPMLAVVLILSIWIMWFATIGLLSEICHGKYFFYRCIFSIPFSFSTITISRIVWQHYR